MREVARARTQEASDAHRRELRLLGGRTEPCAGMVRAIVGDVWADLVPVLWPDHF